MNKPDFGASHDFAPKRHGIGEIRISRTVYMKEKHLRVISEYAQTNNTTLSEAFDHFLQMGLAYSLLLNAQTEITDFGGINGRK